MPPKNLYILGTRGIPAAHGGFETFAQDIAIHMARKGWHVTVYCQSHKNFQDEWQGIRRIHIASINTVLGTAWFDLRAIIDCLKQKEGIWLTLGYNTGLLNFLPWIFRKKQIINMDGVEWRRAKWSWFYKAVFYFNYWCAGLAGDVLIADNPGIQDILQKNFKSKKIKMIPYGANRIETADHMLLQQYALQPQEYALVIARPEPENNILEIVAAWSVRPRGKKLVVLGDLDPTNAYHVHIRNAASNDVVFPGAIYDKEIVQALRFHAAFYIHGHSVGGTNPSLVEALGAGNAVIAHDNIYNRWTADKAAVYFKTQDELEKVFDGLNNIDTAPLKAEALQRHSVSFRHDAVMRQYEDMINAAESSQSRL